MTTLDKHLMDDEFRRLYAEEAFVIDVTERLCEWMEVQGVSRAELARRLGTSRSAVTQALSGRNISVRRLAAMVHALDGEPAFHIVRRRGSDDSGTSAPGLQLIQGQLGERWRGAVSYGEPRRVLAVREVAC